MKYMLVFLRNFLALFCRIYHLRLEVAMHYAIAVQVRHRVTHLQRDCKLLWQWNLDLELMHEIKEIRSLQKCDDVMWRTFCKT